MRRCWGGWGRDCVDSRVVRGVMLKLWKVLGMIVVFVNLRVERDVR